VVRADAVAGVGDVKPELGGALERDGDVDRVAAAGQDAALEPFLPGAVTGPGEDLEHDRTAAGPVLDADQGAEALFLRGLGRDVVHDLGVSALVGGFGVGDQAFRVLDAAQAQDRPGVAAVADQAAVRERAAGRQVREGLDLWTGWMSLR